MEMFHITDIISILGLPYPPSGQASYYVQCPCCDENPYKKHLNINLKKEVLWCPRCGISGGIFDLYSLYTGVPRNQVLRALVDRLGTPSQVKRPKIKVEPMSNGFGGECPITDIESRHATYSALLDKLSLSKDHRENLLSRGLKEADIERLGYKTTPVVGMASIAKQLQMDGLYLAGVPGFYRSASGAWTFVQERRAHKECRRVDSRVADTPRQRAAPQVPLVFQYRAKGWMQGRRLNAFFRRDLSATDSDGRPDEGGRY